MTNTQTQKNIQEGLQKLAENMKAAPRYCDEHRPCDAKEHDHGRQFLYGVFGVTIGSLMWGFALWLGVNPVLSTWLDLLPKVGYWTCVGGIAGLYALRMTLWEGVRRR